MTTETHFTKTEIRLSQRRNPETGKVEYQWRSDAQTHSPVYDNLNDAVRGFEGMGLVRVIYTPSANPV